MSKYGLDKFYTKKSIAKWCIGHLDLDYYDLIIEPAVGSGSFYNEIKTTNKLGIDIEPDIKGDSIIKSDFLTWEFKEFPLPEKILFIGNPPFGRNGSLALKFIKKCCSYNADIAFILPKGFKKRSVYDKIPLNYKKVFEKDLPKNTFNFQGEDYDVPCVFQIYKPSNTLRKKEKKKNPKYFTFTDKNNGEVSIRRVGVNAGSIFNNNNTSESSHYYIKTKYKDILLNNVNKDLFSNNDTTGPRSISKNELIDVLDSIIDENIP